MATTLVDKNGNPIGADKIGNLLAASSAAPYQNVVGRGAAYYSNTTTAVASVIAIPTTAHGFAIQNVDPDGGRVVIIDAVAALITVNSGAALAHLGIIANLGQARVANVTDAAVAIKSLSGQQQSPVNTAVRTLLTGTALDAVTGVAANWFPLGVGINTTVNALPGTQISVPVNGMIQVLPGRMFALHTLGSVITSSAQFYIFWHEERLPLL